MKNIKNILQLFVFSSFIAASHAAPVDDLLVAVKRDSDISVRNLLSQGVDVNARDANGRTALTVAIREQSAKVLPILLGWKSTSLNATNQAGESPLMMAIISDQSDLARQLVGKGAAINKAGWTPLHYAATRSNIDIMRLLLDKDAYIDTESPNGTTPLMMAAQYGNSEAMQFLLNRGADPWARNGLGLTALDFAQKSGVQDNIDTITSAQRRKRDHRGKAQPVAPLSPASAAQLKGLPIPEDMEPVPMIYPESMELK